MAEIRSFMAVELPPSVISKLEELQDRLRASRADVRWVRVQGIHLTLKFFGNIEEDRIASIATAMDEATIGKTPFTISAKGLGAFPSARNPRVIWVGLQGWEESLLPLQREMEAKLETMGFPPEGRPYRPHLTLGRVKSLKGKENLVDLIERERDATLGLLSVDRIVLFKSDLRPTGPIYTPLTVRELTGG
jgi:2'-5' RNA ligase